MWLLGHMHLQASSVWLYFSSSTTQLNNNSRYNSHPRSNMCQTSCVPKFNTKVNAPAIKDERVTHISP